MPALEIAYKLIFTAVDNGPEIIRPTLQHASILIAIDEVIRRGTSKTAQKLPKREKRGRPSKLERQNRTNWIADSTPEVWLRAGNRHVDSIRDALAHDWNKTREAIDTNAERWLISAYCLVHEGLFEVLAAAQRLSHSQMNSLVRAALARYHTPATTTGRGACPLQETRDRKIYLLPFNIVSFMRARRRVNKLKGLPTKDNLPEQVFSGK